MDELFDICGSGCDKPIHKQCASSRRCPFHVIDNHCVVSLSLLTSYCLIGRLQDPNFVSRVLAVVPIAPALQPSAFAPLQDTGYQVAVIKDAKSLGVRTKSVRTHANDLALVVATPTDGNCLPTAMLRCLHGGRPLSLGQERAGMLVLRQVLADLIKEHNWPHHDIAAPQTIEECIEDVATDGGWCGEVAIVAFATLAGIEIRLWRYNKDKKDESVIEPLMASGINEGVDRITMHLLQTRSPRPGKPEFASHWENIIMKPSVIPPHALQTGPCTIASDKSESFDWVVDPSREPPLRLAPWSTVTVKGRGQKKSSDRIICQLKRKGPKSAIQAIMLGTGARGKYVIVSKPLTDIAHVAAIQATPDDIKSTKDSFTQAIAVAAADADAHIARVVLEGESKKGSRKKTPVIAAAAVVVPSRRGLKRKRTQKRKAANSSDDKDDEDDEDDDAAPAKPVPKRKGSRHGGSKKKASPKKVAKKSAASPVISPAPAPADPDTPKSLRIRQLEKDVADMKATIAAVKAAPAAAAPASPSPSQTRLKQILESNFHSSSAESSSITHNEQQPGSSSSHTRNTTIESRILDMLEDSLYTNRLVVRRNATR
jgi:hypothetical protein